MAVRKDWPTRDAANMLLLIFFTGMWRSERFKLETADVDFHMLIRICGPNGCKSVSIGLSEVGGKSIKT